MNYTSTRNLNVNKQFSEVTLSGMPKDGGLFVPNSIPKVDSQTMENWSSLDYVNLATEIISLFATDIEKSVIQNACKNAYSAFTPAVVPIHKLDDKISILELYHGPTMSFKDVALQFLGQIFEYFFEKNPTKRLILTATSGDTGSAAIHAFKNSKYANICVLHPFGKISNFQRIQMTSVIQNNVKNIAVHGVFDDCQNFVKQAFASQEIADKFNLMTVNSINWGRVIAQIVYYFYSYFKNNSKPMHFSVPTGNSGNVLSGFIAKQMGIDAKFTIAVNENDTLYRFYKTGKYEPKQAIFTTSNAIDIINPSNFERIIWFLSDDKTIIKQYMESLKNNGYYIASDNLMAKFRENFTVASVNMQDSQKTQEFVKEKYGKEIDPHTAVAMFPMLENAIDNSMVLSTAHPIKFDENAKLPSNDEKYFEIDAKFENLISEIKSMY